MSDSVFGPRIIQKQCRDGNFVAYMKHVFKLN